MKTTSVTYTVSARVPAGDEKIVIARNALELRKYHFTAVKTEEKSLIASHEEKDPTSREPWKDWVTPTFLQDMDEMEIVSISAVYRGLDFPLPIAFDCTSETGAELSFWGPFGTEMKFCHLPGKSFSLSLQIDRPFGVSLSRHDFVFTQQLLEQCALSMRALGRMRMVSHEVA